MINHKYWKLALVVQRRVLNGVCLCRSHANLCVKENTLQNFLLIRCRYMLAVFVIFRSSFNSLQTSVYKIRPRGDRDPYSPVSSPMTFYPSSSLLAIKILPWWWVIRKRQCLIAQPGRCTPSETGVWKMSSVYFQLLSLFTSFLALLKGQAGMPAFLQQQQCRVLTVIWWPYLLSELFQNKPLS